MEGKLDLLTKICLELQNEVKTKVIQVDTGGTDANTKITNLESSISAKLNNIQSHVVKITQQKLKNLEEKIDLKLDLVNRHIKRNNAVFMGVEDNFGENDYDVESKILHLINNRMHINCAPVDLEQCYRLGKRAKLNSGKRPVYVRFASFKLRQEVFNRKNLLRSSRIFIHEDLSKEVRRKRYFLRKYLKDNRIKGRAIFKYDKLILDGVTHTVESLGLGDYKPSEKEEMEEVKSDVPSEVSVNKRPNNVESETMVKKAKIVEDLNAIDVLEESQTSVPDVLEIPLDVGNVEDNTVIDLTSDSCILVERIDESIDLTNVMS